MSSRSRTFAFLRGHNGRECQAGRDRLDTHRGLVTGDTIHARDQVPTPTAQARIWLWHLRVIAKVGIRFTPVTPRFWDVATGSPGGREALPMAARAASRPSRHVAGATRDGRGSLHASGQRNVRGRGQRKVRTPRLT